MSCQEIFSTWLGGGTLVIPAQGATDDMESFLHFMQDQKVERLFAPYRALEMLALGANARGLALHDLKYILTAGEQPCMTEPLLAWLSRQTRCTLINQYGPTETHVVSAFQIEDYVPNDLPPIGAAISNTQLFILDPNLNPLPAGVTGDLYVGGVSLARGYHGRPGLTAERFVPNPFAAEAGGRLYRTGDLARRRPDGAVEYLGRRDSQVKVRGFRIELGEIEACLRAHAEVREAVVVARTGAAGPQLVGYVVARAQAGTALLPRLKVHLQGILPEYMVPAHWVLLETVPLTPNGKLDRGALPEPERPATDYIAPRTANEELLAGIWRAVLHLDRIGITDNFFELGGDSILSLQIVTRARQAGLPLTLRQLFERQTLQAISEELAQNVLPVEQMLTVAAAILDEEMV